MPRKTKDHLDTDLLDHYAAGTREPEDVVQTLLEQLSAHCPGCRARIGGWKRRKSRCLPTTASRLFDEVAEQGRRGAPATLTTALQRLDDLLGLPDEARLEALEQQPSRYVSRLVVRAGLMEIEKSFPQAIQRVADLLDLMQHVLRLAEGQVEERFRVAAVAVAAAWRVRLHVVLSNYGVAERWSREARSLLPQVGDTRARALVDEHTAYLRMFQGRSEEAVQLLAVAVKRYQRIRDPLRAGRSLLQLASVQRRLGDLPLSLDLTVAAEQSFPPATFDRLCAQMQRALVLCDLGEFTAALDLLHEHRRQLDAFADVPSVPLRRQWLEGRARFGLGQPGAALACLEAARGHALAARRLYDAALVSLDMALIHLERDDRRALRREAEAILPILASEDLPQETAAALGLYHEALASDRLEHGLVRDLGTFLSLAQHDRTHRFRPTRRRRR